MFSNFNLIVFRGAEPREGFCRSKSSASLAGLPFASSAESLPLSCSVSRPPSSSPSPLVLVMSGEEEENAAELKIGDEFLKAKCLMNCEVARILDHKYDQLQQMSADPTNQISQVFEKSMQYVKRFSNYKNTDAVRQARDSKSFNLNWFRRVLSRYKLAEFELCVLGNLCPDTVEEAIAIVPSIKIAIGNAYDSQSKGRKLEDDAIEKMLHDLSLIKKFE
ncbi:hypothetical protein ZIOFF_055581 [Zingiber officinale]|uniref:RNA polymerase Rpb4/RPC9 core domain-containing protein n=1 Tax=Zingiber officinale TaxID=94328 RepID=A0A8J5FHR1_ZINOF|nr:hypothetical protein ZIOFF_055581 [Zingiber officinale]